jgi:hypothetical protein
MSLKQNNGGIERALANETIGSYFRLPIVNKKHRRLR